ncbi:hypothetical protein O0L34_g9259 [Tuta absoluta]|nr:hypothetical protein O0L34_g9259 [Tuta absoluta]
MKKDECLPICDMLDYKDKFSKDWVMFTKGRFRFQFRSSSNVNTNMDAHYYSVTVTTARMRDSNGSCFSEMNETECYAPPPLNEHYCITSSVVCDGINNCGVKDWFDEKKSDCDMPQPLLSWVSIFAVVSLIICTLLAGSHILLSSFPQGTTYFVFNSNEDNRFCLNPTLTVPDRQPVKERRKTFDYNSSDTSFDSDEEKETTMTDLYESPFNVEAEEKATLAKDKKQSVSKRLQQSIHSIAWRPSLRPTVLKKLEEVL